MQLLPARVCERPLQHPLRLSFNPFARFVTNEMSRFENVTSSSSFSNGTPDRSSLRVHISLARSLSSASRTTYRIMIPTRSRLIGRPQYDMTVRSSDHDTDPALL
jgi:hypothetical protein